MLVYSYRLLFYYAELPVFSTADIAITIGILLLSANVLVSYLLLTFFFCVLLYDFPNNINN